MRATHDTREGFHPLERFSITSSAEANSLNRQKKTSFQGFFREEA
jgi:hypothetical protein